MKRKFKKKHQSSSSEDKGDTAEKQEELVEDREESADINPNIETLLTEKCLISEEREFDVQDQGAQFAPSLCYPLNPTVEQPVKEQATGTSRRRYDYFPLEELGFMQCGSSLDSKELHRGEEMLPPIFPPQQPLYHSTNVLNQFTNTHSHHLTWFPPCGRSVADYIGNQNAPSAPAVIQSHLPLGLSQQDQDAVKQFSPNVFVDTSLRATVPVSQETKEKEKQETELRRRNRRAQSWFASQTSEDYKDEPKHTLQLHGSVGTKPGPSRSTISPDSQLDLTSEKGKAFVEAQCLKYRHCSRTGSSLSKCREKQEGKATGFSEYSGVIQDPAVRLERMSSFSGMVYSDPGTLMDNTELHRDDNKKSLSSHKIRTNYSFSPFSPLFPPPAFGFTQFTESDSEMGQMSSFGGHIFLPNSPLLDPPSCSPSIITSVNAPPLPESSEEEILKAAGGFLLVQSENEPQVQLQGETEPLDFPATNTLPSSPHLQFPNTASSETRETSRTSPHSHSVPSLSPTTCVETKTLTGSKSLPELKLKRSFEEFTPDISVDEDDETYRFQCSCPGLYQCTVTGLVFHMEGEGDVVYRTVPWNRTLLGQHHKKPAGPLFGISCLQQSVCQLHLPHCEILSTGGSQFLSVAHVTDEGIEFICPQEITETHVVINITGFSGYGNVKDEDSPPDPVRVLVLLFYRPPDDPDPESFLSVLLVPRNIVLHEVQQTRRKLIGDERYIETSPHCELHPDHSYTLSTCPQDNTVKVQPKEAKFDELSYDNYFPSFQVILKTTFRNIELLLRETNSSLIVWESEVYLPSTKERRSSGHCALNLPPNNRLKDKVCSFIDRVSEPVLKSLLDKLLENTVITDSERESVDEMKERGDKARFIIKIVKNKAAESEMIKFLHEVDPCLCKCLEL